MQCRGFGTSAWSAPADVSACGCKRMHENGSIHHNIPLPRGCPCSCPAPAMRPAAPCVQRGWLRNPQRSKSKSAPEESRTSTCRDGLHTHCWAKQCLLACHQTAATIPAPHVLDAFQRLVASAHTHVCKTKAAVNSQVVIVVHHARVAATQDAHLGRIHAANALQSVRCRTSRVTMPCRLSV